METSSEDTDFYFVLGIRRDASGDDVKAAFRALAKRHHPDVGGSAAAFKRISVAYEVLSDQSERRAYNASHPFAGVDYGASARTPHPSGAYPKAHVRREGGPSGPDDLKHNPFDTEEWQRMHFGPTGADRDWASQQRVREAQAGGFSSFNRADGNAGSNWEARRRAREHVRAWAEPGASETDFYRRYATEYRASRVKAEGGSLRQVALWVCGAAVLYMVAHKISESR